MKTILVINIPEDFDYRRCSIGGDGNIYYERKGEQRTSIIGNIKNLKPVPQKKDLSFNELHFEEGYIEEGCTHGWKDFVKEKLTEYDMGYNACIDEILGEKE